jgi:hypothetical protein
VLLPSRRLTLTSSLPPAVLLARLPALIGPGQPFAGEVVEAELTARRRRTLARFGLPVARGRVRADAEGSAIELDLRLDPLFVALYATWAVIMLAAAAALVNASLRAGHFDAGALGPAALVLFVHGMVHASFAGEAALLRRWLEALAKGRTAA